MLLPDKQDISTYLEYLNKTTHRESSNIYTGEYYMVRTLNYGNSPWTQETQPIEEIY